MPRGCFFQNLMWPSTEVVMMKSVEVTWRMEMRCCWRMGGASGRCERQSGVQREPRSSMGPCKRQSWGQREGDGGLGLGLSGTSWGWTYGNRWWSMHVRLWLVTTACHDRWAPHGVQFVAPWPLKP